MASLANDPGGTRRIQFKAPDGRRKTIRLGKMPLKQALVIQRHVERMVAAKIDGSAPPEETSRWLAQVTDKLRDRLVRVGLAHERATKGTQLSQVMAAFKAGSRFKNLSKGSRLNYGYSYQYMLELWGDIPITSVTAAQAEDLRAWLMLDTERGGKGFAESTANRLTVGCATLFRFAIKCEILHRNPFDGISTPSIAGNNVNVPADVAHCVIRELRGSEYKLAFALGRWGGLRIPSETNGLRWADVDWEKQRFTFYAPKTGTYRTVPIFPELAPLFDERFSDAAEGDEYVLPTLREYASGTITTAVVAALRRAGVEKWPRLFHSLRSTRETELADEYPIHVVCDWIGNSPTVAHKHYLKVKDEHFAKAAQKAAQQVAEPGGTARKPVS